MLEPLPRVQLDVRVLERGSNRPLANAEIFTEDFHLKTGSDGRTELSLFAGATNHITILKPGYLDYVELVETGPGHKPPNVFYLIPKDPDRQLELGLVNVIEGVGDADGIATLVQNLGLAQVRTPNGRGLRTIVEGGVPPECIRTEVARDHAFRLITTRTGPARVLFYAYGEPAPAERNLYLELGRRIPVGF